MYIRILDYAEPLAPDYVRARVKLAETSVHRILVRAMEKYHRREVHGRSFLIAGHRGVGKTTVVRQAIQDVSLRLGPLGFTPLLVTLPGPELLDIGHSEQPRDEIDSIHPIAHQAMKAITVSLYRALCEKFVSSFEKSAQESNLDSEAPSQLRLLLDEAPEYEELRGLWKRWDLFERGVLPAAAGSNDGKGSRELVALASAAQAFRRVSGVEKWLS